MLRRHKNEVSIDGDQTLNVDGPDALILYGLALVLPIRLSTPTTGFEPVPGTYHI